jgi:selenocysteine-specific elongation factor
MAGGSQKRVVLGTAGHIDHGKTSLVRALTGIDTDRLKEEKERGITIELGFAHLTLPSGEDLAIVDVPGHERFVRNMVAGVSGIDFVLLVVAADEGVMPQTREHLEICSLLQVPTGLVALTKIDMVDPELVELAREDVTEAVAGTFLEGTPILPVSAVTGEGLEALLSALDGTVASLEQRSAKGAFRLPVDRVFTMKGFGTVVTGTVVAGAVRKDDEVEMHVGGRRGKVRGIQVHGRLVERASAGQRVALNLSGLELDALHRGDTASHPGELRPSYMVDARLQLLPSAARELADRSRLRLHLATQEVPVTVALLDRDELLPGDGAFVQLRSREQFIACPGDPFVVRALSPVVTVGGGRVLDQRPRRHKGRDAEVLDALQRLEAGEPGEQLRTFLQLRDFAGLDPLETQVTLGVPLEEARRQLQLAVRSGAALVTERKSQLHHAPGVVARLEEQALEILAAFHREHPLRKGLGLEELRTKFPRYIETRLVEFVLQRLSSEQRVIFDQDRVRRSDFTVTLSADDEELRGRVLACVEERGYAAPTREEIAAALGEDAAGLQPVLDLLVSREVLTRTKEGFFFATAALQRLVREVVAVLERQPELGVTEIKEITGTTRKYTIPLLEYLDGRKITMRRGDVRVLGPRGREARG